MTEFHIVMLGNRSPNAAVLQEVVDELDAALSVVDGLGNVMLLAPDAIVLEVDGPEGIASLHALANQRGGSAAPIIAVVPHDANKLLARASDAGADDFIFSPVHPVAARATLLRNCRLSQYEKGGEGEVRATLPYDTELGEWIGLLTSAPDVILRVDVTGRVQFANRAVVKGLEPAGKLISEVGIPNLGPEFFSRLRETIRGQQPTVVETCGMHPTLGERHYTLSLGPIVSGGSVNGVAVIVADVSEKRAAERALRENQQQLLTLVETAPDYITILDADGIVRFLNRSGNGMPREEVVGQSMARWLTAGVEKFGAAVAATLKDDETHDLTFETRGSWFEARMRRITFDGVPGVICFATDVTERIRAERELRNTARRMDLLLRNLPLVLFEMESTWNGELQIGEVHASGFVAGHAMDALSANEFASIIHPDDLPGVAQSWSAFAAGELEQWGHEYRIVGKDGSIHWLLGRGVRVGPERMLGFSIDVTERKDLEAKLVHAGKMEAIGRLAGGVAHDFNNLLTSIVNFTWYVRDELPEDSVLRDDLGEVLKAAESGARLTSQLLAFSRRKPSDPTVVELNERIDQVRRVLERTIGENIRLEFRRSAQLLPAIIDPGQLDQLVFNLAVNARDAMPSGGTLTFNLSADDDMAVMEVVDDGMGIPVEIQDRLFEPFFSTKGENGTGLGLATCYGIARQAGGDIHVESQPGRGAKFVVRLPLASMADPAVEEPQEVRIAERTGGRSVALVVEDQPAILKLVRRALEHAGWFVHTAASAEEALQLATDLSAPPGVLLTDVVLPGLSGVDLASALRERWPDLPVLLVSGYLGDEFEPAMSAKGRTAFLPKPFNSVQLVSRLAVLLGD